MKYILSISLLIILFSCKQNVEYSGFSFPQSLFDKAEIAGEVNVKWTEIGAKLDGKTDDLPALKLADVFCKTYGYDLFIPNGVLRITDGAVFGYKFIHDSDAKATVPTDVRIAKSFNYNGNYILVRQCLPYQIRGGNRTIIYADFDDSVAKAVITIGMKGDKSNPQSTEFEHTSISDISICTRGYIDTLTGKPKKALTALPKNKLIGIVALYQYNIKLSNITYLGLDEGLILNQCPGAIVEQQYFSYCNEAMFNRYSQGVYNSLRAYDCKVGLNINSSDCIFNYYQSQYNHCGMIVNNSYNIFNSCYFETNAATALIDSLPQLVIGQSPGDKGYNAINAIHGTQFNNLKVASVPTVVNKSLGIEFKETARRVEINSGRAQSIGYVRYANPLTKVFIGDFLETGFPNEIKIYK